MSKRWTLNRRKFFQSTSLTALLLPAWLTTPSPAAPVPPEQSDLLLVDLSENMVFNFVLSGDRTTLIPLNSKAGQSGFISIQQDSVGSRTLAFSDEWKFTGGSAPALSSRGNAADVIHYVVKDPDTILTWMAPDLARR
jgi:hypothetical protein